MTGRVPVPQGSCSRRTLTRAFSSAGCMATQPWQDARTVEKLKLLNITIEFRRPLPQGERRNFKQLQLCEGRQVQGSFGLRAATRSCAQVQRCVCLLAAAAPRRAANLFDCASVQLGGCDGNDMRPQRVQSQSQAEPYSLRLCPSLTGLAVRPAASAQGSSARPSRTCQAAPTSRRCPPRSCWSTERRLGGAAYHLRELCYD